MEGELFAKYISVTEDGLMAICCAVISQSVFMDKEVDYPKTPAGEFTVQPHLGNKKLQCCYLKLFVVPLHINKKLIRKQFSTKHENVSTEK